MITTDAPTSLLEKHSRLGRHHILADLSRSTATEVRTARRAYLDQIGQVKTIWQTDKIVSVSDFYFPTRIEISGKSFRADTFQSLVDYGPLVVEGIAGQGKSMFLRHLALDADIRGSHLPVFVQLRYIDQTVTLTSLVTQVLERILGCSTPSVIEYLLRKRLIVFLLDGFDEIGDKYRNRTIRELHDFLDTRQNCPIIISARPNSDIQNSPLFQVAWIKPLSATDRLALIRHLVDDAKTCKTITDALKDKDHIAGVLLTPLLVTLLIITYKAENDIPENLSDFYRSLFITLLRRHDRTKPGYNRERQTTIGNVEFERIFETLSFLSLNQYKLSLTEQELFDFVRFALNAQYHDATRAEDYIDDLLRITCLVVQDGEKYYYLHKSIPEYFAAQKVASEKVVENKRHFYQQLRESEIPENWHQTLFFLSEIDEICYVEELLIPSISSVFNIKLENGFPAVLPRITKEIFLQVTGPRTELIISQNQSTGMHNSRLISTNHDWFCAAQLQREFELSLNNFLDSRGYGRLPEYSRKTSSDLVDCLDQIDCWPMLISHFNSCEHLKRKYSEILAVIRRVSAIRSRTKPIFQLQLKH